MSLTWDIRKDGPGEQESVKQNTTEVEVMAAEEKDASTASVTCRITIPILYVHRAWMRHSK